MQLPFTTIAWPAVMLQAIWLGLSVRVSSSLPVLLLARSPCWIWRAAVAATSGSGQMLG